MERKTGLKGLVLTLNDNNKGLTDAEAKKLCKRLRVALKDMAKRKGWSYVIWIFFSRREQDPEPLVKKWVKHEKTAKRPHFHVILYANPCRTIVDWINNYWNTPVKSKRQSWGKVHKHNIYDYAGFTGYCNRQKAFKERRQEYTGAVELDLGKICDYEKAENSQ